MGQVKFFKGCLPQIFCPMRPYCQEYEKYLNKELKFYEFLKAKVFNSFMTEAAII